MKDKNQIIGWVLMALVLFGYMAYSNRNAAQQAQQRRVQDSIENIRLEKQMKIDEQKAIVEAKRKQAEMADSLNPLFDARKNVAGTTVIKNELLALTINNKGGQIEKAELLSKKYKGKEGGNVILFDKGDNSFEFSADGKDVNIKSTDFFFSPKVKNDSCVVMTLPIANGSLDITYTLVPNSYLVKMDIQAQGIEGFFPSKTKTIDITWTERMKQQEKGFDFENRYATITYRTTDDDTEELSSMGGDEEETDFDDPIKWISYKDQFFSQILISNTSMKAEKMSSEKLKKGSGYLKTYTSDMTADFDPSGKKPTSFSIYLGPNDFSILSDHEEMLKSDSDLDLRSLVYLGFPVIRWINRFFMIYFFDWLTGWGLNMGIVLLILTLAMKALVYPLMRKSIVSSSKMRVLKPHIDEISKKYPNPDQAMQKQQEIMQLYSEYGSNPLGGCLPMLIQMPIFIALFNFIPNAIDLRGQSFLWADDLSTYDDIINWGFDVWGIGDHLSLFCVLWCISTVATSYFSMRQQKDTMTPEQAQQMGMMKWFSYLMPLIFFFSFNDYSSGLNYYYFVSSVISVIMMWTIRHSIDDAKLLAQLEERRKKRKADAANGKKPSSMFARFQEMQQLQMQQMQQQQQQQQQNKNKNK